MIEHPRDEYGRVLPHPGWPSERAAPGGLEFLRRFCNTVNRENRADRLGTAGALDGWLLSEGRQATAADASGLDRLTRFREALFAALTRAPAEPVEPAVLAAVAATLAHVRLRVMPTPDGLALRGACRSPVDDLLADLALILLQSSKDGTLTRLRPCTHCSWVIYDSSKNRSARWCSMSACGARHNARAYRRRQHTRHQEAADNTLP